MQILQTFEDEERVHTATDQLLNDTQLERVRTVERTVLQEYVCGSLFRERARCTQCGAVHDTLNAPRYLLDLSVDATSVCTTLMDLYVRHCSQQRAVGQTCPLGEAARCDGLAYKREFLER